MTHEKIDKPEQQQADPALEKALLMAGKRTTPPAAMAQRWETAFQRELQATLARRSQRRYRVLAGLCAAIAVLGIYLSVATPNQSKPLPLALVVKTVGEAYVINNNQSKPAAVNQALASGDSIKTTRASFAAISYAGASIRIDQNSNIRLGQNAIELLAGQLYIDTAGAANQRGQPGSAQANAIARHSLGNAANRSIAITTPLAVFRDIGTQFTVSFNGGAAASAVREGSVVVTVDQREYIARAEPGHALQIDVRADHSVSQRPVASSGEAWRWASALAPSFATHGRSAYEFLAWASRETGLALEFEPAGIASSAKTTTLHGDIALHEAGNNIDTYIALVLSTTRMSAQRTADGRLRITSAPGA